MDSQSIFDDAFLTEEEQPKPSKAKSIAGLILGIVSLLSSLAFFVPVINWIVSLVTCIVSKALVKKQPASGLKKGAKITSTIALIIDIVAAALIVLAVIAIVVAVIVFGAELSSMLGLA